MPGNSLASDRFLTNHLLEIVLTYPSEYAALSDADKDRLKMIISCGVINMNNGSYMREKVFEMFPSGDIYDALTALLAYTAPE